MAQPIRSKLSTVINLIRDRLILKMGFPAARVIVTAEDDDSYLINQQAEQYVWLRPGGQVAQTPIVIGSGRWDARVDREMLATLRTRMAVDEPGHDVEQLTNSAYGHLDHEHLLIDALYNFQPVDKDENWLVFEPIMPRPVSRPRKDRRDKDWCESTFSFNVGYMMDLDLTYL